MSAPPLDETPVEDLGLANTNSENWEWPPEDQEGLVTDEQCKWKPFCDKFWGQLENSPQPLVVLGVGDTFRFREHHFPGDIFSPAIPGAIVIRKCYVDMFQFLWTRGMARTGNNQRGDGVIISGTPGIGKTMFLPYLLVRLLQHKQNVIFSADGENIVLFYFGQIYTASLSTHPTIQLPGPIHRAGDGESESPPPVFIWSLFNVQKPEEPNGKLTQGVCFPIQTTHPDPCRYNRWQKFRSPIVTGFPLWKTKELLQGLRLQTYYPYLCEGVNLYIVENGKKNMFLDIYPRAYKLFNQYGLETHIGEPNDVVDSDSDDDEETKESTPKELLIAKIKQGVKLIVEDAILHFGRTAQNVFNGISNFEDERRKTEFGSSQATMFDVYLRWVAQKKMTALDACSMSESLMVVYPVFRGGDSASPVPLDWKVKSRTEWIGRELAESLMEKDDPRLELLVQKFTSGDLSIDV